MGKEKTVEETIKAKFRNKALDDIVKKKKLTADQERRLWARASAAKRFILRVIAPELLDLRVRTEALEDFVLRYCQLEHLPSPVCDGIERETKLEALADMQTTIRHKLSSAEGNELRLDALGGQYREQVWKGVEDRMVADIVKKQRDPLLNSAGIDEKD